MKKSLVFAMAMALGVSATAFAANPFSDVPAGHWAYAAVAKLAAAGIVDGYPDGTYKGDRTMTRYEMAQIVAKALAKGAIGADDKLVGEFADELDNLGVRVAKLEKNADNVKITGKVKLSYSENSGGAVKDHDSDMARLRTDIFFTGEVNDNWHYVAMLRNQQFFEGQNESGDDSTDFQRAYLTGNIGVVNITAGRYNDFIADGNIYDNRVDAVKATVPFGEAYLTAEYGKMAGNGYTDTKYWNSDKNNWVSYKGDSDSPADKFWMAELGGTWGNWDLAADFIKADDVIAMGMQDDDQIWTVGATYHTGKFYLGGMYLAGDDDALKGAKDSDGKDASGYDDDGYVVKMGWAGAKASDPGSWGLYANYYDQGAPTVISHTMDGLYDSFPGEGFKGYKVGGNVTLAKNMIASVDYYDLKGKETDKHARTLWSQLVVTF
ncbi:S-layer homology domain-containing protein [uncultured Acidaminococcus sp.]|uniref:S-layer homology domain-containing protein n=1 Tax=uncultured Acidaminococcus sp. TaxID=352152 RepID=UPI0025FA1FC4|nr:S-layer homology domain-containing protein [uncultured Acidaminococcus sp.]